MYLVPLCDFHTFALPHSYVRGTGCIDTFAESRLAGSDKLTITSFTTHSPVHIM